DAHPQAGNSAVQGRGQFAATAENKYTTVLSLAYVYSTIRTVISIRSRGLSRVSRGWATILSATSIPFTTSPKTVYLLFRYGAFFTIMKNCEPALSGSWAWAIETTPRTCGQSLNSALTL